MLPVAAHRIGVLCFGGGNMTEWIRNWLLGVSGVAMAMAVAEAMIPKGSMRHICRLAGGLLLLLTAVSPVLNLDEDRWTWTTKYQTTVEGYEMALSEQNNLIYQSIIEEKAAAYILDKAKERGISCQVEVALAIDGNGNVHPGEVRLFGSWTDEQRAALSRVLEAELGILPERQYFERSTG